MISLGQVPDNTWFPDKPDKETRTLAVSICEQCPIMAKCRDYGLAYETEGIWGGVDRNPPKETSDAWTAMKMNKEGKCSKGHELDLDCPDRRGGIHRMCSSCIAEQNHRRYLAGLPVLDRVRGLLAERLTSRQIAVEMGVHYRTVERYRKRIKIIDSERMELAT